MHDVIPYGVDNLRQFQTPVYAIFCRREILRAGDQAAERRLIKKFLSLNHTIKAFMRERVNRVREVGRFHVPGPDAGFNLAILGDRGAQLHCPPGRSCAGSRDRDSRNRRDVSVLL
jgi:hypothetical protein